MKRILFIALVSVFVSNFVIAQTRSDLISREKIAKNKVTSVSQWTHKYVKDKVDPKGYISVVTTYDKNGNAVEVVNYKPDGKVSSKQVYKYDNNNRKVEYLQYQILYKPQLEVSFKQNFTYDEKGNKKTEVGFDGKTNYRILYTYFPDGKQKEIVKYNSANQIEEHWIFEQDKNTTKISIYKLEGKLDKSIIRKYDNDGNLIDETNFSNSGKELGRITYQFDKNGLMNSKTEYYGGTMRATYNYNYDSSGQLFEVYQISPSGDKILYSAYRYDNQGNMLEEKWFDGQPDDYSKRNFKLDNKGNLNEVDAYYSDYKYKVVYKYTYKFN